MVAKPPLEIWPTAGMLPPAPTTPPALIVGRGTPTLAVTRSCTDGIPAIDAVTTTGPGVLPKVRPTPATPAGSVAPVPALSFASPEVTAKFTGIPATGTPARNATCTPSGI